MSLKSEQKASIGKQSIVSQTTTLEDIRPQITDWLVQKLPSKGSLKVQ